MQGPFAVMGDGCPWRGPWNHKRRTGRSVIGANIMVTAEGWIRAEGKPVTKEALVQAAEEAMREEVRLTGGSV